MKRIATLLALFVALALSLASGSGSQAEPFDPADPGSGDGGSVQRDASSQQNDASPGADTASSQGLDAGTTTSPADAALAGSDATAGGCSFASIFYDSPATCSSGSFCSVDQSYAPTCVPDSAASGGSFYGPCGANNACPRGSMCAGASADTATCAPFCSTAHSTCPDNGVCAFNLPDVTGFMLCGPSEACDPVTDTGCDSGHCYVTSPDANMCLDSPGAGAEDASCTYANECAPGLLCTGTCKRMCNLGSNDDCNSGETCQSVGHPSYGVCA